MVVGVRRHLTLSVGLPLSGKLSHVLVVVTRGRQGIIVDVSIEVSTEASDLLNVC